MTQQKRLLRMQEVRARTGLSTSSLYNRMNSRSRYYDPHFPKQIRLGANAGASGGAVAWDSDEITAWIDGRKELSKKPTVLEQGK